MKKIYFTLATLFITVLSFGQLLYIEDFEVPGDGSNYTTSDANGAISEFSDGSSDFFLNTSEALTISGGYVVSSPNGSNYFAAQDIDGEGATRPLTLTTKSITVTGHSTIDIGMLIAEDDDGSNQDWDDPDYLHITYSIDGGLPQNLLWIEGEDTGSTTNNPPRIDTNFDGEGNGTEITSTFAEYIVFDIPISGGDEIVFTFEFDLNSGDEDIAIDYIRVYSDWVLSAERNEIENFTAYPNPVVDGRLTITTMSNAAKSVQIFDVLGKQVLATDIQQNGAINVESLNAGVYILKVVEEGKTSTSRLLIE